MANISQSAFDLIVTEEVSSEAYYTRHYQRPEWPGGNSGVTIAIGYDLGMCTAAKISADWSGRVNGTMLGVMMACAGIHGDAARQLLPKVKAAIIIPWPLAIDVFANRDVPEWTAAVQHALPNTDLLNGTDLGALVSLAYNRGAGGFNAPGDRYREMRNIRTLMASKEFAAIPAEITAMQRLWPRNGDLWKRRDHEASLFARGLVSGAAAPAAVQVKTPVPALPDATVIAASREDQLARTKPPESTPTQHATAGGLIVGGIAVANEAHSRGAVGALGVTAIIIGGIVVAAIVWWLIHRNRNPVATPITPPSTGGA